MKKAYHPNKGVYLQLKTTSCKVCDKNLKSYINIRGSYRATCSRECHKILSSINMKKQMKSKNISVMCKDSDGNIVKKYTSLEETKYDGFNPSNISSCLKKMRKTHHGFTWEESACLGE